MIPYTDPGFSFDLNSKLCLEMSLMKQFLSCMLSGLFQLLPPSLVLQLSSGKLFQQWLKYYL